MDRFIPKPHHLAALAANLALVVVQRFPNSLDQLYFVPHEQLAAIFDDSPNLRGSEWFPAGFHEKALCIPRRLTHLPIFRVRRFDVLECCDARGAPPLLQSGEDLALRGPLRFGWD